MAPEELSIEDSTSFTILMLRLYWPKEKSPSIIDGTWTSPAVERVPYMARRLYVLAQHQTVEFL